jgi:hypothetical protein
VQLRKNFSRTNAPQHGGLAEKYGKLEDTVTTTKSREITVRARVIPRAKER